MLKLNMEDTFAQKLKKEWINFFKISPLITPLGLNSQKKK